MHVPLQNEAGCTMYVCMFVLMSAHVRNDRLCLWVAAKQSSVKSAEGLLAIGPQTQAPVLPPHCLTAYAH